MSGAHANLVMSIVTPNVPVASRIIRDWSIADLRGSVAEVLREARRNGYKIVVNRPGVSWTVAIQESLVYVEIHP